MIVIFSKYFFYKEDIYPKLLISLKLNVLFILKKNWYTFKIFL